MTATARRFVVFAGSTPNPRQPTEPQALRVMGVAAVRLSPFFVGLEEGNITPTADFWDVLTLPDFDASAYVRLYEAELHDDGSIIIKRDLFGKNDYPHTWGGWPIPGDEPLPAAITSLSPQSREYKALAPVRAAKSTIVTYKGVDVKLEKSK